MSNDSVAQEASEFRCPVCNARQNLSDVCRRCQADLTLVVRARRRWRYLLSLPPTEAVRREIEQLAPAKR